MITIEFLRFVIVGGLCTLVNFGLFLALYQWTPLGYLVASSAGFVAGVVIGFFLNRAWTYSQASTTGRQVFLYALVYVVSLGETVLLMPFLVERLKIPAIFANIVVIGVTTISNFLGTKFLVFHKPGGTV